MTGDSVIVINCKDIAVRSLLPLAISASLVLDRPRLMASQVTGQKREQKLYRKHSGCASRLMSALSDVALG